LLLSVELLNNGKERAPELCSKMYLYLIQQIFLFVNTALHCEKNNYLAASLNPTDAARAVYRPDQPFE
jgi:hypothetical protein